MKRCNSIVSVGLPRRCTAVLLGVGSPCDLVVVVYFYETHFMLARWGLYLCLVRGPFIFEAFL